MIDGDKGPINPIELAKCLFDIVMDRMSTSCCKSNLDGAKAVPEAELVLGRKCGNESVDLNNVLVRERLNWSKLPSLIEVLKEGPQILLLLSCFSVIGLDQKITQRASRSVHFAENGIQLISSTVCIP